MTNDEILNLERVLKTADKYSQGGCGFAAYARAITNAAHRISCCLAKPTKIDAGMGEDNDRVLLKNHWVVSDIQAAAHCLFSMAICAKIIPAQEAAGKLAAVQAKIHQQLRP